MDLVRKRGIDMTHVPPLDPLKKLLDDFISRGGTVWACPPCVKARGYTQDDFVEGVAIQGASAMHELIKSGDVETVQQRIGVEHAKWAESLGFTITTGP